MNKKIMIGLAVAVIVAIGGFLFLQNKKENNPNNSAFIVPELHIKFMNVQGLTLNYTTDQNNNISFYSDEIKKASVNDSEILDCNVNAFSKLSISTISIDKTEYKGYTQKTLNDGRYLNISSLQAPCYTNKALKGDVDLITNQENVLFNKFVNSAQSY